MTLRNFRSEEILTVTGTKIWLTTFNDLITLLLVFFVLIYSLSHVDKTKVKHFQNALQSGLGVLLEGKPVDISDGQVQSAPVIEYEPSITSDQLPITIGEQVIKTTMQEFMRKVENLQSGAEQTTGGAPQGIRISLENSVLFKLGRADISPAGRPVLDKVGAVIHELAATVRIEGHTDDIPIHTQRFPSNWELSIARAVRVLRYLTETAQVPPQRLSAVGYGDSRPLVANHDPKSRAQNRRVEIVLEIKEEEKGYVQ